ncbi:MAG: phage tail tube protein [Candidatus Accumulibacter sp.]|jgi:hypothetical protein|nr:phage tail tube protein [Accumulibacter sp.]
MPGIIGRAYIRVNGMNLNSLNGATLNPGGFTREPVLSDYGYAGYTEKTVNSEVSCDVAISDVDDITALGKIVDTTITFEGGNGAVYVIRHASVSEPPELDSSENKAGLKFIGAAAEKA